MFKEKRFGCQASKENGAGFVSCHGDMKPLNDMSRSWSNWQLKGIKGKISFLIYFSFTDLLPLISWHDAWRPRGGGNWLKCNK